MTSTDVRIGLLLQNAQQMLGIIRRTFPTLSFGEAQHLGDCSLADSPEKTLSCLWSNVASLVDVSGQVDTTAAQYALTLVCKIISLYLVKV